MHHPKYSLFFDNHTMKACPDVGRDFDAEAFASRIADCGVDFITFHARCNQGFAYYPTEIGIRHPSLKEDLFGKIVAACGKKGIAVSAYFNGGISNEEGLMERNWTTLSPDGRTYREPPLTPYVRTMCYQSGYRERLRSMIREVAARYPVAGFFIDCLAAFPCVCPTCVAQMKKEKTDWRDAQEVKRFAARSVLSLIGEISRDVRAVHPDALLYFNGPGFEEQADAASYFECECLPTNPGWGYHYLPVMAHYIRTLGDRPVLNMTGRFYDWGDFGGLRPKAGIEYDLLYGLANGMRPNIGCHFHPRGELNQPVLTRIEAIYKRLQRYQPWHEKARPVAEIAICFPKGIEALRDSAELKGAVRMLSELKLQFDVVTERSSWNHYALLILPDTVTLNEGVASRLREYLDRGGKIIATGRSGLDPDQTHFVLEEWGVDYEGDCPYHPAYFEARHSFGNELPQMPIALYEQGIRLKPHAKTEIGAEIIAPYYNREWDGERAYYYLPPDRKTGEPLLTIHRNVAHISHPIFTTYQNAIASVELRQLFSNTVHRFLPRPLLKTKGLPSFGKAFATAQQGCTIIHLLSYVPELRGRMEMIEEGIAVPHCKLALRMDKGVPRRVLAVPEGDELPWSACEDYIHVDIPIFEGYQMIVFEFPEASAPDRENRREEACG